MWLIRIDFSTSERIIAGTVVLKIFAIGCDISPKTGEGFLAQSLIDLMRTRFSVAIYTDWVINLARKNILLRDRVLPIYISFVCLFLRIRQRKVVLLNYVPIWNFLNAVLARCGVRLAPMTGSALLVPARASMSERVKRKYIQKLFIMLTKHLLPARTLLWCATPSVFIELQRAGLENLCFGFPYLNKIQSISPVEPVYDIFIYSGTHPVKNHEATRRFITHSMVRRFKICYVGPAIGVDYSHVHSYHQIPEEEFNQLLATSRLYVTFSYEDAGITGFKALAYGINVLCPLTSGLAFALEYDKSSCYLDPYDVDEIYSRVVDLLGNPRASRKDLTDTFHRLKEKSNTASAIWLASL